MKMIKSIYFCVLLLAFIGSSLTSHLPEDDEQDPNAFVDSLFETALKKIHKQGAIPIPGEHKLGPFGALSVKDINLINIGDITRKGDSHIRGDQDSGIIYINTTFTLKNLHANSSFLVNLPMKGIIRVHAYTVIKSVDMTLRVEYNPLKGTIIPKAVHIDSYSGAVTEVHGLGPFNPIVEKMATITADVLEKIIAKLLNLTLASKIEGVTFNVPQQF